MSKENVDSNTDFLPALSHEIKNVLNIINAMCTMAGSSIDDREKALKYLNGICNMTERITAIMDRSLDISRLHRDKEDLIEREFCIDSLKEEILELFYPLAREKGIDFRVNFERSGNSNVIGDYDRLFQVLMNLATNSVKYTPRGGTITISMEEETSIYSEYLCCRFICRDNGIGIPEDFLQHIFEPFARADDDRVRKINGTGLGMVIIKEAVDAMGGNIHIDSMIDVGTTVTIRLKFRKNIRKG